jgi:hypothetical protein
MGTTPCCCTENNFDFLTTREASHCVVRDEFGLKTEIGEVLLNFPSNEGTEETETLGLTSVNLDDFL